jgi:tetratricopeptide (TPR) repeat protein
MLKTTEKGMKAIIFVGICSIIMAFGCVTVNGQTANKSGDYKKSITFFDEAIKKYMARNSTLVFDAFGYQGMNYYHLKKYDEALKYLEEVQKTDSNDHELNKFSEKIKILKKNI